MKFTIAIAAICALAQAGDEFAELQAQVYALEHSVANLATENAVINLSLSDVTNEVAEMREAFRLVTNIMVTEFEE